MTSITTGLQDSSDVLDKKPLLAERVARDGYLFVRGLLPRDEVLGLRHDILEICRRYGWLRDGSPLDAGIADLDAVNSIDPGALAFCGVGVPPEAYAEVQKLESFHCLAHNTSLVGLYETLFGSEVLVHPRNIARVMLPAATTSPTPAHQDYIHIQGTKNVWTSWVPVGDIPRELGGLSVLRGSNRDGLLPVKAAEGAGSLEVYLCNVDYEWVEHDYEAGDVLAFTSLTVHRAIPNRLRDRVRLSCDFRYQPADEPVEAKSLEPHCNVLPWERIYEDWTDDRLKYYWQEQDLAMADWDETVRWQKEKIC
jgi:hypothetical protein